MSRRAPNPQSTLLRIDPNPYKITSLTPPKHRHHHHQHHTNKRCQRKPTPQATIDIGFSDATTTDTYNDYYDKNDSSFQHSPLYENRNTDFSYSDDSGSTRLPYYEFDEESRNSFTDQSVRQSDRRRERSSRYEEDPCEERLYHEIQTPCDNGRVPAVVTTTNGRRPTASRMSDRPQSSMSSALTSAVVYGCGGKCQTFESICYFVLQLVFTMGVLIGLSLCIAGLVLRKSAARNLQVLVYIGIMLAIVSALLLTIQCRAKNTARRRIKAIQNVKRAPIQMETFNLRNNPVHTLDRLPSIRENPRVGHLPQVHTRPLPHEPQRMSDPRMVLGEQQGVPWWRRTDLQIV